MYQPTAAARSEEYVFCLDTRSSSCRSCADETSNGDVEFDINFSNAFPVERLAIGSVELPLAQYTIEKEWSRVYFSEGIYFQNSDFTQFVLEEYDGSVVVATVPVHLNSIIDIDVTDPFNPIFQTEHPHGLDAAIGDSPQWSFNGGFVFELAATALTDSDFTQLTKENYDAGRWAPLASDTFVLKNIPATAFVAGEGTLVFKKIPSIKELLAALEIQLNAGSANFDYHFYYDYDTNKVVLALAGIKDCETRKIINRYVHAVKTPQTQPSYFQKSSSNFRNLSICPSAASKAKVDVSFISEDLKRLVLQEEPAFVLYGNTWSLFGFVCQTKLFYHSPLIYRDPAQQCATLNSLFGGTPSIFIASTHVELPEGNYNSESMAKALLLQMNRFFFDPAAITSPTTEAATLTFYVNCDQNIDIPILFGFYNVIDFLAYLQSALNAAVGASPDEFLFSYDATTDKIIMETASGNTFGVRFNKSEASSTYFFPQENYGFTITLAERMGFRSLFYRGRSKYTSDFELRLPKLNDNIFCIQNGSGGVAPSQTPFYASLRENLSASNVYNIVLDRAREKYAIGFDNYTRVFGKVTDAPFGDATLLAVDLYLNSATSVAPDFVWSLSSNDVVRVYNGATGNYYSFTVNTLHAGEHDVTRIILNKEGVTEFDAADELDVCVELDDSPYFSIFFNGKSNCCGSGSSCGSGGGSSSIVLSKSSTAVLRDVIRSDILGFSTPETVFYSDFAFDASGTENTSKVLQMPAQYNLAHPDYLLMQLVEPLQSRQIEHHFCGDILTDVLAKLVVYPNLKIERAMPMENIFVGYKKIKTFRVRILNPDHTLYHFHGKHWSVTVIFNCKYQSSVEVNCFGPNDNNCVGRDCLNRSFASEQDRQNFYEQLQQHRY